MKTTTLSNIKKHDPCSEGWGKLLKYLGKTKADDEELSYLTILESNGLDDAIWCCVAESKYDRDWRLFAVWCARKVERLMADERSINALKVSEDFANGDATQEELTAAWAAARDAAWDAARDAARAAARDAARAAARDAAWDAARAAAGYAARAAARDAAWDAARDAAWDAAGEAAWDAAWAAARDAAGDAAWDAAWDAARDAAGDAQEQEFRKVISVESYYPPKEITA